MEEELDLILEVQQGYEVCETVECKVEVENDEQNFEPESLDVDVKPVLCNILGSVIMLDDNVNHSSIEETNQTDTSPDVNAKTVFAKETRENTDCHTEEQNSIAKKDHLHNITGSITETQNSTDSKQQAQNTLGQKDRALSSADSEEQEEKITYPDIGIDNSEGENTNTCSRCKNVFASAAALKRHVKYFSDSNLCVQHKSETCTLCGRVFAQLASFKKHLLQHTGQTKMSLMCEFCGKLFHFASKLAIHMSSHQREKAKLHPEANESLDVGLKSFISPHNMRICKQSQSGEKSYMCSLCGKTYRTNCGLSKHMSKHPNTEQCEIYNKSLMYKQSPDGLMPGELGHKCTVSDKNVSRSASSSVPNHKCTVCNKLFWKPNRLKSHMRVHTGEEAPKPHKCEHCDKSFARKFSLNEHMHKHTGNRPYMCEICSKSFGTLSILIAHTRIHKSERKYSCTVCDKSFKLQQHLEQHAVVHTKEKPYQCPTCDKAFTQLSSLKKHIPLHVGNK